MVVTGIELKPNLLEKDSTLFIEIVMVNKSKDCKGGPDYNELFVVKGNDTLEFAAINGIPRYQKEPHLPRILRQTA